MSNPAPPQNCLIGHEIAIIGMSGRFPACENVEAFWNLLVNGQSGVRPIEPNPGSSLPADPNFVPMAATVDQADCFDASFFGILPRIAQEIDPQHRLFLEACWLALEDAGYRPDETPGRVGLYAGCHMNTYIFLRLAADARLRRSLADSFPGGNLNAEILNDKDYLATRVAYQLNLRGPAVAVQTACSTSLVAVAEACKSLEAGQCEMALAGGATVTFPQNQGYLHTEDSILSPDGFCRTFDADAKGTIFGDGVGAVLLKRLADAVRDGDPVYAVIKGWGVNNDGADKGSYTAPSVSGQRGAILAAQRKAQISADTINYLEAHGTGTLVGDPIEIAALTESFRETTSRNQYCAIGSLKSNFGHLDVAAGVTAVIKVALALNRRMLPANLNFRSPNPRISFEESPFFVQTKLTDWPENFSNGQTFPRRAGISSFGVGGTNAHLILEEFVPPVNKRNGLNGNGLIEETTESEAVSSSPRQLFCLSARNPQSLDQMCDDLVEHLGKNPDQELSDISFTLAVGRKPMSHRFCVAAKNRKELVGALCSRRKEFSAIAASKPGLAFLFPGQGSQHVGMAQSLYQNDSQFARHLDQAAEALAPHVGLDLRSLVFGEATRLESLSSQRPLQTETLHAAVSPAEANRNGSASTALQAMPLIDQTAYAQPSIFMISYALGKWMMERGFKPDVLAGHSVGEFAAATIAGVMSLDVGARLIATRGRLMQQLPCGSMMAVNTDRNHLQQILPKGLEIAAYNAENLNVVAGPTPMVKAFEVKIENGDFGDDVSCRLLRTSHAFHTAMMDGAIEPFAEVIRQVQLNPPQIKLLSTVTGQELSAEEATSVDYWANQIRRPVEFCQTVLKILEQRQLTFCELGPNQALTTLVRQAPLAPGKQTIIPLLPHVKQAVCDRQHLWEAISRIWRSGFDLDWGYFFESGNHNNAWYQLEPQADFQSTSPAVESTSKSQSGDIGGGASSLGDFRRVHLPTYRFERKRYWFEVSDQTDDSAEAETDGDIPVALESNGLSGGETCNSNESCVSTETSECFEPEKQGIAAEKTLASNPMCVTSLSQPFQLIQQQMLIMQRQIELLQHSKHTP